MGKYWEKMREARRKLHDEMSRPALYIPAQGARHSIEITVRVFEKWNALGDLKGTNFNYAEINDISPSIVFLVREVNPVRGAFVSVEKGNGEHGSEVYRIDNVKPADDITITAGVVKLTPAEADIFKFPRPANG